MSNRLKDWVLTLITLGAIAGMIFASVSLTLGNGNTIPSILTCPDPQMSSKGMCPKTKIVGPASDCFKCHVPVTFKLKEADPCAGIDLPVDSAMIQCTPEGKVESIVWRLTLVDSDNAEKVFAWVRKRGIKKVTIEVQSPGGSLFEAWRIVGIMREFEKNGGIVETRCYGFAASAGFLILSSGTKGYRYAAHTAHLMWHELISLSLFKIETPSSSEETSKILRKLQNIANTWLSEVSCMKKEEIDAMVRNKDFWMTGEEAKERCFIDHLIDK